MATPMRYAAVFNTIFPLPCKDFETDCSQNSAATARLASQDCMTAAMMPEILSHPCETP
jgi:hypothetical protein